MNEDIAASCEGKQAFASRALADKVQTRRCKQFDRSYESGRPYRCRVCGQFHIGTKQPVRSNRDMRHYRMRGEAALKRAMA